MEMGPAMMGLLLFALGIELLPLVKTIGDHKAAIAMADGEQIVMAGLWAKWKSPTSGEEFLSCTILTCRPGASFSRAQPARLIGATPNLIMAGINLHDQRNSKMDRRRLQDLGQK